MATVLVTGGTGTLGARLVGRLVEQGHTVRAMTRKPGRRSSPGVLVRGDVRTGEGVDDAARGVDVIVHAATSVAWRARATEIVGTRHALAAARRQEAHLVYVSIVGVDQHSFPYYRAKHDAELLLDHDQQSGDWTIQRITQFHDLLERMLSLPVVPLPKAVAFQPVDVGDAAECLAEIVVGQPLGWATDLAGPHVLSISELARIRRERGGRGTRRLPVPAIGPFRDFAAGTHLAGPDARLGTRSWSDYQAAERAHAD